MELCPKGGIQIPQQGYFLGVSPRGRAFSLQGLMARIQGLSLQSLSGKIGLLNHCYLPEKGDALMKGFVTGDGSLGIDRLQYKICSFLNSNPGNLNLVILVASIGLDYFVVGEHRFVPVLCPLGIGHRHP